MTNEQEKEKQAFESAMNSLPDDVRTKLTVMNPRGIKFNRGDGIISIGFDIDGIDRMRDVQTTDLQVAIIAAIRGYDCGNGEGVQGGPQGLMEDIPVNVPPKCENHPRAKGYPGPQGPVVREVPEERRWHVEKDRVRFCPFLKGPCNKNNCMLWKGDGCGLIK